MDVGVYRLFLLLDLGSPFQTRQNAVGVAVFQQPKGEYPVVGGEIFCALLLWLFVDQFALLR